MAGLAGTVQGRKPHRCRRRASPGRQPPPVGLLSTASSSVATAMMVRAPAKRLAKGRRWKGAGRPHHARRRRSPGLRPRWARAHRPDAPRPSRSTPGRGRRPPPGPGFAQHPLCAVPGSPDPSEAISRSPHVGQNHVEQVPEKVDRPPPREAFCLRSAPPGSGRTRVGPSGCTSSSPAQAEADVIGHVAPPRGLGPHVATGRGRGPGLTDLQPATWRDRDLGAHGPAPIMIYRW
jgi:hypothetical protein